MDDKAHLPLWLADDLDPDRVGYRDLRPLVAGICKGALYERPASARCAQ
jgi:hypothetical protein